MRPSKENARRQQFPITPITAVGGCGVSVRGYVGRDNGCRLCFDEWSFVQFKFCLVAAWLAFQLTQYIIHRLFQQQGPTTMMTPMYGRIFFVGSVRHGGNITERPSSVQSRQHTNSRISFCRHRRRCCCCGALQVTMTCVVSHRVMMMMVVISDQRHGS